MSGAAAGEPAKANPGAVDPGEADPGEADPGEADPGTAEPGGADPGTADPGVVEPGAVERAVPSLAGGLAEVWRAVPRLAGGLPEVERAQPAPAAGLPEVERAQPAPAAGLPEVERGKPAPGNGLSEVERVWPAGRGRAGRLIVAGAPLGQAGDVSPRLREALGTADVIAAEDTRRLHRLAADLEVTVTGRLVSYYDAVEAARVPGLLAALAAGSDVVLISDGGMPAVSDPGYRLVRAAAEVGYVVTSLPGPSAVTTALAVSGLPSDRFCFEGFLPRTAQARTARLAELREEPRTMIFFEAPHRVAATLEAMGTALGPDRRAVACRELTKTYEEIVRGSLAELQAWAAAGVRGELTLVVAGCEAARPAGGASEYVADVAAREGAGATRKEAIAESAKHFGVPKREVYDAVVAARRPPSSPPAPPPPS